MRTLTRASAVAAAAVASLLVAGPAAYAQNAPGDNGDVKIHNSTTAESEERNEPHVCTFYLDAFHFDGLQAVSWQIAQWAPTSTKGNVVDSGTLSLDADGHGRTTDLTLPDGHYKLYWNFDGENGRAKQKVFWVECGSPASTPGEADAPTPSVGEAGAPTPSVSSTASGAASPSAGTSASGAISAVSPSASDGSDTGNLAETGASVGGISAAAALLLGAGAALLLLRRKAAGQRH